MKKAIELSKRRRLTYFVLMCLAGIITPAMDPVTIWLLWLPMCAAYEVLFFIARRVSLGPAKRVPGTYNEWGC